MQLTTAQAYDLLAKHGCYVTEACDRCGQLLGSVRYTRKDELGAWCSRECRGDRERPAIHRGGRPRKHLSDAEKQRAYRQALRNPHAEIPDVTKPPCSLTETKELQT